MRENGAVTGSTLKLIAMGFSFYNSRHIITYIHKTRRQLCKKLKKF